MKRAPEGRYTREFRQEAVKLVLEENLSLPEAGRRLSLPASTLGYWVKLYKVGKLGDVGKSYRPNAVWVTDITYVPTDEGWLYLAGHKDLFTGEIVGYAMGERLSRNLVSQSLLRALSSKRPSAGVLHHSDRGSQYCSQEYRSLLERFGLQTSMSRTGNCFDNAPMESFWGTLKQELVHHRHYRSRREAVRDITEYVESFYNRQRRQARLGFLSPAAYEKRYYVGLLAA